MPNPTELNLSEAIASLTRTPAVLDVLLRGLPENVLQSTEGPDTWSPQDILGHLLHGERTDWLPRVRILLDHGESRPFDPFDRFAQSRTTQDQTFDELLDEFARLRAENLAALQSLNLQPEDLTRKGTHPVFGQVTLAQLLATWTTHDLTHLHQLSRVLAYPYRVSVGPWSAYLGVLHCNGRSAAP